MQILMNVLSILITVILLHLTVLILLVDSDVTAQMVSEKLMMESVYVRLFKLSRQ